METNRQHIPQLDGLRAVALLLVLGAHWPGHPAIVGGHGGMGVSIFFTLSGFLITRILLYNREHSISLRNFWIHRVARILPLYFTVLVLIGLWLGFTGEWWQCATFTYCLLRTSMDVGTPVLSPFWSLCVEEHFYLVWPLIVLFSTLRQTKVAAVALTALGCAFLLCLPVVSAYRLASFGTTTAVAYFNTLSRIAALTGGCLLALNEARLRRQSPVAVAMATLLLIAAYASLGTLKDVAGLIVNPDASFPAMRVAGTFWQTFTGIALNLTVLLATFHTPKFVTFLASPAMRWLGGVSYCVYLIHIPIWTYVGAGDNNFPPLAFGGLAVILLTAELSKRCLEVPVRQWARALMNEVAVKPAIHA